MVQQTNSVAIEPEQAKYQLKPYSLAALDSTTSIVEEAQKRCRGTVAL